MPQAVEILKALFPYSRWEPTEPGGYEDKHLGIDGRLIRRKIPFSVQCKFRKHEILERFGTDFLLETANGDGTPGEMHHMFADMYLLAWADETDERFRYWALLDGRKIRDEIVDAGGAGVLGTRIQNHEHGSAEAVAIPLSSLESAVVESNIPGYSRSEALVEQTVQRESA